jgi:tetratricopeptide (TPR) repeat protein
MQLGQFHEAEQKLQHSIKMQPNPSYQDALKVVAEVNVLDKNLKDGSALCFYRLLHPQQRTHTKSSRESAFQAELDVLKLKKDWKAVTEFLDRYLARFVGNDMLWCQKGVALGELADFTGAFHCLSKAITINKNSEAVSFMKKFQDRYEQVQVKKCVTFPSFCLLLEADRLVFSNAKV